ncbi:hypothetical protein Desku_1610 [Desulfofundulus kuznetsovii DSM 6115]|uniref:Uncharacterized protein n=1 Tax=Desulfofundulus kuznetsovii (strain DSM 6115 / VKM B-1805 / 17) TaxID=760568 RepID=A0AAU8PPY9_DESK7|nr:hypothetical protein Desku_1610 [Desulfofundulus kuznetsovii DSM 6115]
MTDKRVRKKKKDRRLPKPFVTSIAERLYAQNFRFSVFRRAARAVRKG